MSILSHRAALHMQVQRQGRAVCSKQGSRMDDQIQMNFE
jgi:hypothetical protein